MHWLAVIDLHHNRTARIRHRHPHPRAERQVGMRRGQLGPGERLAAAGRPPDMPATIPRGGPALDDPALDEAVRRRGVLRHAASEGGEGEIRQWTMAGTTTGCGHAVLHSFLTKQGADIRAKDQAVNFRRSMHRERSMRPTRGSFLLARWPEPDLLSSSSQSKPSIVVPWHVPILRGFQYVTTCACKLNAAPQQFTDRACGRPRAVDLSCPPC